MSDLRFAAKAGAKHVIGVDMSTIIEKAREIVEVNGMSSQITLLQGKMEEVKLPFSEVDIIISEWMGYFLLYESMMDTVLYARDKYLVKGGLIFPDKATIFMAGIEDGEYKEEKIGCENLPASLYSSQLTISQSGTTYGASTTHHSRRRLLRSRLLTQSTSKLSPPIPPQSSHSTSTQSQSPTWPSQSLTPSKCGAMTSFTP